MSYTLSAGVALTIMVTSSLAGIGDNTTLNMNELKAIASEPNCMHMFLLHDFEEVESLKYAIEERTCKGT